VRRKLLVVVALSLLVGSALADVKLSAVLGSNMVLQRGVKLPVWGTADPGEDVTVTLGDQKATTKADAAGKWRVDLKPLAEGGPIEVTVQGKNTLKLTNVLIGDVWICSGQSNMAMTVNRCTNADKEAAEAKYPQIRLFTVKRVVAATPQADCEGSWDEAKPETVPGFSAAAYFFGRELHKALGVPVGLINTSWGGTPAEAWTERSALEADKDCEPILERWKQTLAGLPAAQKRYEEQLAKWKEVAKEAKAKGKQPPRGPRPPAGPGSPHMPAGLYNAMIAPLVPLAAKGAIWYQGEANAGRAYQYRKLLPAMILSWRKAWAQDAFYFFTVQLPNFRKVEAEPVESDWAELREAQAMTLSLPQAGIACVIDVGEAGDIHPKNKQTVGQRLALAALKMACGKDVVASGPMFDSMKVEGNKAIIKLKCVGGGLATKPFEDPVTPSGPSLKLRFGIALTPELRPKSQVLGFAIAGEDKKFVWADAKIEGDSVVVSSDKVAKPVAVRYAWENNPICNLYNKDGLPAVPFRTDDWPGVTVDKR